MDLKGTLIIVTGASKGIGLATVNMLLARGARVAGWSRNAPPLTHEHFFHVAVDITEEEAVDMAWHKTLGHFGTEPDAVVNNAGVGIYKLLEDLSSDDWHTMFRVNVHPIYYTCKRALPGMKARGRGHIINIASLAGRHGLNEATGYSGTKFAVRGISEALQRECKAHSVKVTCIFPGSVNTPFFDHTPGTTANDTMLSPDDIARAIVSVLETDDNCCISELDIRPMVTRYK